MSQTLIWLISAIGTASLLKQNAISTTISTHVTPRQEDGLKGHSSDSTHCRSWSRRSHHLRFSTNRRTVQQRTLRLRSHVDNRCIDRQDRWSIRPGVRAAYAAVQAITDINTYL